MPRLNISPELESALAAINALRTALDEVRQQLAKRRAAREALEAKYNPRWADQPRAPAGSPNGGQWINGGGGGSGVSRPTHIPKQRGPTRPPPDPRTGIGGNRPPLDSLRSIFAVSPNTPPGAILAPLEPNVNLSGPGFAANEQATRNLSQDLVREIHQIDPSYQASAFAEPGGFPNTIEGRNNLLNALRADRAAALYRERGEASALQVETLRFMQRKTDEAYTEGVRLYNLGRLSQRLSREEAIGNYVDGQVRIRLRAFMTQHGISTASGEAVRVNNRAHNSSERTYRIPDARVGNVAFDVTLTQKTLAQPQIRGFFSADFRPAAVVIVRPSQLGPPSTYLITRPLGN